MYVTDIKQGHTSTRFVADLLPDGEGLFQVGERRLVIALRLEYLRNIVERGAFARFVADLLPDGEDCFR